MISSRLRVPVLMLTDVTVMFGVWAFDVWAYEAIGVAHYLFGCEHFLRHRPAICGM